MNVRVENREIKISRNCRCVSEADLFIVDRHTDEDGYEHLLLWDTGEADTFAIGFRFYGYSDEDVYGWRELLFGTVDVIPDKCTAMQAWINLTKEG